MILGVLGVLRGGAGGGRMGVATHSTPFYLASLIGKESTAKEENEQNAAQGCPKPYGYPETAPELGSLDS